MKRFALFLLSPIVAAALSYEINFVGIKDEAAIKAMFDASELVTLQDKPPASINGLRYRIASDIPALIRVLHAYGYYDAAITSDIENEQDGVQVYLFIRPGPQYTLSSYKVYHGDCTEIAYVPNCNPFTPEELGLCIGAPVFSPQTVNAELQLLTELAHCGYPLATVEKRRIEVDMANKTVEAAACINEGPFSKFGPTILFGLKSVKPRYIQRKIAWKEGDVYDPDLVEETQKRLLNSDLFSSVLISHGEELDAAGELPLKMKVTEAKHRQLSIGGFYATVDGPGVVFGWTHRNVRGMGETVSLNGDFSRRYIAGILTYKKPDFLQLDQSYRALAEIERENIRAYLAFSYRFANYIERKIDKQKNVSIGLKVEHINVAKSATNGSYLLMGLPLFGKYNTADNLLDPSRGFSIVYQLTPFQSLDHGNQRFVKQRLTGTFYIPMTASKKLILALRMQLGSIAGARRQNVPLPKLFLGGSEDDLRGYRYKTVSPLTHNVKASHRKPLGGRSAVFASVELRFRVTKTIGFVPFADFGTVTSEEIPQFNARWYKSVGAGLRYFAFFGPLRFDVGFPLDRRKGIDSAVRFYAAVGQAF